MRTIEEIRQSQKEVGTINVSSGDYVFATKYIDAAPTDRWRVDFIDRIDILNGVHCVFFKKTGVIPFRYVQKVSDEEGPNDINRMGGRISLIE